MTAWQSLKLLVSIVGPQHGERLGIYPVKGFRNHLYGTSDLSCSSCRLPWMSARLRAGTIIAKITTKKTKHFIGYMLGSLTEVMWDYPVDGPPAWR